MSCRDGKSQKKVTVKTVIAFKKRFIALVNGLTAVVGVGLRDKRCLYGESSP